jgi:predicted esterase
LPVEGHLDAVVAVPVGALAPRPVLVATHGAGGSPEEHCGHWHRLLGSRAFILCPRGVALNAAVEPAGGQYFYDGHPKLAREIRPALTALTQRFAGLVDARGAVYVGFSQGATMGALALPLLPGLFSRALLIEGGDAEWDRRAARIFRAEGGVRVLFACGRSRCAENARRSAGYLEKERVEARVLHAEGAGHTYGGPVEQLVRGSFEWLVADDPRWSPAP